MQETDVVQTHNVEHSHTEHLHSGPSDAEQSHSDEHSHSGHLHDIGHSESGHTGTDHSGIGHSHGTAEGEHTHALPPSEPTRSVAVDVGDGVGALIVRADVARVGEEVEIHPVGRPDLRQHVWVLEREVGAGTVFAAIFPSLSEGRYAICVTKGGEVESEVEVLGGVVSEGRWG